MSMFTPDFFVILKRGYTKAEIKADIIAGLTVAVVALPIAMAFAVVSGASPGQGLITAVIAGVFVSLLGGSRVQIGGPTGAFVVVIYSIIAEYGYDGLIMATFLAGIILIIAGYSKMGVLIKFVPQPVLIGFTTGIAIIIASSQIKDFFGLSIQAFPADCIAQWHSYFATWQSFDLATFLIAMMTLVIILVSQRYAPKLPHYLIAIGIAGFVTITLNLPISTIGSRFPELLTSLPWPELPVWDFTKFKDIFPSALTIAFLVGVEALLSATVADGMTGLKHNSNQELVGQGFANIASAMFGGLPATGAIARTAVNIKAGAKTPLAGIFKALFLLLFIYFAMDILAFVPMAALAATLFVAAWKMSEMKNFVQIFRSSNSDRFLLILTLVLTVLVDLTVAISVGVILASFFFMHHMSKSVEFQDQARLRKENWVNEESRRVELPAGVEVFQVNGPLFFGVANKLLETLQTIEQIPKILILRMRFVSYLDASGVATLRTIVNLCQLNNVDLIFSALQHQPAKILLRSDILNGVTGIHFQPHYKGALAAAQEILNETSPSGSVTPWLDFSD